MSRTNPLLLVLMALAGGVAAWALEVQLVSGSAAAFAPSPVFGITLVLIAIAVLAVAWPVRRYTASLHAGRKARMRADRAESGAAEREAAEAAEREAAERRVNPFRAVYALALAKASSLAGSIFAGAALGAAAFLVTRTVIGDGLAAALFAAAAALVLVAAGLVAESWCALPPDEGESGREPSAAAG